MSLAAHGSRGLCIGYDCGDAVSSQYRPKFEFTGGRIVKVVFDVANDVYIDVERHIAARAWWSGRGSMTFVTAMGPGWCPRGCR